jgi:alanyl-tRNA synthetase
LLKLTGESSVSSGVRRVEALSGMGALDKFREASNVLDVAREYIDPSAYLIKVGEPKMGEGLTSYAVGGLHGAADALRQHFTTESEERKRLRRELDQARMKSAASSVASATDQAIEIKGVKVLSQRVAALDRGQMRTLVDNLRNKLGSGVVVLGSAAEDGKVALIVGVTKDLTSRVQAGKVVGQIAQRVGGSGGGRPDLAEAGGKDATQLDAALAGAPEVVGSLLG